MPLHQHTVEMVAPAQLKPCPTNPRRHGKKQIEQLCMAIQAVGWTQPIIVDEAYEIVAGHARLAAAKRLKLDAVPVIRLPELAAEQARAARLSDNQIALLAGWDMELLAGEIAGLDKAGYDLGTLGFDHREIDRLLRLADPVETDPDEVGAVPQEVVSRPGDLWLMAEHRLVVGDARDPAAVELAIDDPAGVAMCFTDPPYNVDYAGGGSGKRKKIQNDALGDEFRALLDQSLGQIVARTRGAIYIAMSSSELHTLQAAFTLAGGKWSTFIIWSKSSFTMGRSDYQRQYEPILYGWPAGQERFWCGARDQGDVWHFDKPARSDLHPTMKPVGLVERAIRNSSQAGDTVFDPFAGSGTTLIACQRTGRAGRLIELDPAYADVVVERWQSSTGGRAQHASGTSFAATRAARRAGVPA